MEPSPIDSTSHAGPARSRSGALACGAASLALVASFQLLPQDLTPGLRLAALAGGTATLLTLVAFAWAAYGRRPVAERLGLRRGRAGMAVVLLLVLGLLGLSHALDQLIEVLELRTSSQLAQYDAAIFGEPTSSWPWMLLGLGIAPGIGEEIFFRGLLQRGFRPWLGRMGALLAAASIFGAFHGDPVHAVGAFFLGLYLGCVAEISGGTRAAISCHVLNNVAAVGLGALLPLEALPAGPLAVGGGAAVAGLALYAAWRLVGKATAAATSGPAASGGCAAAGSSGALQTRPGPADP